MPNYFVDCGYRQEERVPGLGNTPVYYETTYFLVGMPDIHQAILETKQFIERSGREFVRVESVRTTSVELVTEVTIE